MDEKQKPKVGVGLMLLKDGKILLGRRHEDAEKASSDLHGEGTWTMPGGKIDFYETLIDGICREVLEETSIKINKDNLKVISVADEIVPDNHYVTIGFLCEEFEGEAQTLEPDEITEWKWFGLNNLPEKVFPPSQKMVNAYLNNKIYN